MSPRAQYLLNQSNIYLNILTVMGIGTIIWYAALTYNDVQKFNNTIKDFQNLQVQQQLVQKDIQIVQGDIEAIKEKLQMNDLEFRQ